jgi:DNA invertase Pin-like site-specific DNA recombinase
MRAPRVISVALAFLCFCAAPSACLGQGSRHQSTPTRLWKKFPFNPPPSRAKQDGATPARRTQRNADTGKGSGNATAIPVAVVLPVALLVVGVAIVVPIAIRRRRRLGKGKSMRGISAARMLRRVRSDPPPEQRAAPRPQRRRPNPPQTRASTIPGPGASAPALQGGPKSSAPTAQPAQREPPPASVSPPAAPSPPRPAAAGPAARTAPSAEGESRSARSAERSENAVGSREAGAAPAPPADGTARAVGYASVAKGQTADSRELRAQAEAIVHACATRGLVLLRILWDTGPGLERPALTQALEVIATGEASCLVVSGLDRLSHSAAELGSLVEWLQKKGGRLIAADLDLDTAAPDGRLAARALAALGASTREQPGDLPPTGPTGAREQRRSSGRPAVADRPALEGRIRAMRAEGMTLQAIADTLNAEGVPTLRGGSRWRPSSVQAATGYKRPRRTTRPSKHDGPER